MAVLGALAGAPPARAAALSAFPIPIQPGFLGAYPEGITSGPDGAMWFSESGTTGLGLPLMVGRITANGTITQLPLPSGSNAGQLAAGPDGALWFTEASRIGRITTSGAVTQFPLPTPDAAPVGIVTGPDGALWFTESRCSLSELPELFCEAGKVGRITTSGAVTEFPLPGTGTPGDGSGPWGIAAGPDGALWSTEKFANRIGRITTDGVVSEFPLPATVDGPNGSAGPGGSLGAGGIATGPDGALWFSQFWANSVGRIVSPAPRVSLKLAPRSGCTSSAVRARVKVTGGAKLARVDLSLDGRRVLRTTRRSFRVRVLVRALRRGSHTLSVGRLQSAGGHRVPRAGAVRGAQGCPCSVQRSPSQ